MEPIKKIHLTYEGLILGDNSPILKSLTLRQPNRAGRKKLPDTVLNCWRIIKTPTKKLINIGVGHLETLAPYELINHISQPAPIDRFDGASIELLSEQQPIVDILLDRFAGPIEGAGAVLKLAAGKGKTYITGYIMSILQLKTLIIVPNSGVSKGWRKMLEAFPNIVVGEYSAKTKCDGDVIIINIRSAIKNTFQIGGVEMSAQDYMRQFGMVVMDEAHNYTSPSFSAVLWRTCFAYRLALTATPYLAKAFEPILYWNIGALLDGDDLIPDATQWTGSMRIIKYDNPGQLIYGTYGINAGAMVRQFTEDPIRHKIIVDIIIELRDAGRNIIVFCEFVDYCRALADDIVGAETPEILIGGVSDSTLDNAKKARVIIVSYGYASEGLSYPHLDTLVFATPRKSRMLQILPRIMRISGDISIPRLFVDIVDTCSNNFIQQHKERKRTIKRLVNMRD